MNLITSVTAVSMPKINAVRIAVVIITTHVDSFNCSLVGQDTFFISLLTSPTKFLIFPIIILNPETPVNKTIARVEGLEPSAYGFGDRHSTN